MPMSVPGIYDAGPDVMKLAMDTQATGGFTLIEMLVVMLIMGLFIGLVSVIVRPDDRTALRVEADRLAQLLELAAEQSRLTGKPVAWVATGSSYRFWQFSETTGWSELQDDDLLHARSLPNGMLVSGLQVENMHTQGAMRLEFVPYAPTLAFAIELVLGREHYMVAASPIGEVRAYSTTAGPDGNLAFH
jgi:general secretion pathway protein H